MNNRKICLFMGPPGSGKDTQADMLRDYFSFAGENVSAFGTGNYIREKAMSGDGLMLKARESVDSGSLLPSSIAIWSWVNFIYENFDRCSYFLFHGGGRKLSEAKDLVEFSNMLGFDLLDVFVLNVSIDTATKRILSREEQREDDNLDALKLRVDLYNTETKESIEFFKGNEFARVFEINGERGTEEIHREIKDIYEN